jgi:hypothetical protein
VLEWLAQTPYAIWVSESWGWPIALTLHAFVVVISIAVTWYFDRILKRDAAAWEAAGKVSSRGVQVAAATCLLWAAVTIGGRLTAYLGSLYPT